MPVPHTLLRTAFATLAESTLRRAAEHNGIRGHQDLSPTELAQRLGHDEGLNLQSYSSYLSLSELKRIAQVFELEHRKQTKAALSHAIWTFIDNYDRDQTQGRVRTLDDALARATEHDQFDAVRERIANKLTKPRVYDSLSYGEQLIWQINWLVWDVENGGFDQYLSNSTGDYAQETIEYLQKIGAKNTCRLLKKIARIFPDGIIPKDEDERNELLSAWEKKHAKTANDFFAKLNRAFYDRAEDLTALTLNYVRAHREEFA